MLVGGVCVDWFVGVVDWPYLISGNTGHIATNKRYGDWMDTLNKINAGCLTLNGHSSSESPTTAIFVVHVNTHAILYQRHIKVQSKTGTYCTHFKLNDQIKTSLL